MSKQARCQTGLRHKKKFVSANGLVGFGTHEAKTAADSITWEVIARKLADLHESS